jgi:hypothetical protein
MNYYEMKRQINLKVIAWLESIATAQKNGLDKPKFVQLVSQLAREYGVGRRFVVRAVEAATDGEATISDDGEVVKV